MKLSRVVRSVCLAGAFAAVCAMAPGVGAFITLAAGLIGLAVESRRDSSAAPEFSEFLPWLTCTMSFAAFTLVLSPLTIPAVSGVLCIFSPLFGTMIYAVERALSRTTPSRIRFGLRSLFVATAAVALMLAWVHYQLSWIRQREAWRNPSSGAIRSTQGQDPPGLPWLFRETGESWIEIRDGTEEQIAEVQRLFPEATVVKHQAHSNQIPRNAPAPVTPPIPPRAQ